MGRVMLLALLLLLGPGLASASVEVSQNGGRVSVRAEAAPLLEVLDRLSRQLGMKVVYEGAPPRNLVNASLVNRTPAEAVLSVLEGLGLNYLARMDVTGARIEQLVIAAPSAPAVGASPPATASAPPRLPPVVHEDEDAESDEEDAPLAAKPPRPARPPAPNPGLRSPDRRPSTPSGTPPGSNGPGPVNYPISPFAPQAPAPPTVIAAPPTEPVDEAGDEAEEQ